MVFKSQLNHYQRMQLSQVKYTTWPMFFKTERRAHTYAEKSCKNKTNGTTVRSMSVLGRTCSATPASNKDHLRSKMAHFKKLGAKAVDSIT